MTSVFRTAESFPDGARVAFIGDSITAAINYCARVVSHYRNHLPERKISFHCAGISGSSMTSALLYYDSYIASFRPTHATIMLGVNDSCRDYLRTMEDAEKRNTMLENAFQRYVSLGRELLDKLQADGVEVTLCTPAPYAEFFETGEAPLPGGYALIRRYAEEVRRMANERGLGLIDFHSFLSERYMTEALYNPDHVHPNDRGHYRMAECLLASQGLTADPYMPIEQIREADRPFDEWCAISGKIAGLYAVEWMVIRNYGLPTAEKLALVQSYIDDGRYNESPYFKNITKQFMENKPREPEMLARLDALRKEMIR